MKLAWVKASSGANPEGILGSIKASSVLSSSLTGDFSWKTLHHGISFHVSFLFVNWILYCVI